MYKIFIDKILYIYVLILKKYVLKLFFIYNIINLEY